jgi:lysyl oxidase
MPRPLIVALAAAAALSACNPADQPAVSAPQYAHVQDLDGTPDLIVDSKVLATSWVVYDQELKETFCTLQEGGVPPGKHRVLRFTVTTPNIGDADVFIGDPNRHWDPNGDGDGSDSDGLFENDACHRHYHFRNYATYALLSIDGTKSWQSAKRGFCMIDVTPWNNNDGGVSSWVYRACGRPARDGFPEIPGNQGISVGYADTYVKWLGGQYFVLDGADGQAVIPPGDYVIRIEVNPGFAPKRNALCPAFDAATGLCHNFLESNYANNVGAIRITIPDHPGKKGFGPGGGQDPVDEIVDDENRPIK